MELKDYQARVLVDLANYLDVLDQTKNLAQAFADHWASRGVRVGSAGGQAGMEPYKNTVPGVPHICAKVPTAGGKTFIAVNALDTVFSALSKRSPRRPKMVVWLVPSLTILDQTVQALSSPEHPYRRRLDQLFRHRVAVYEKRDLLMGAGFSYDTAQEQLSIVVMSFDSLRAKNKEDRVTVPAGYQVSILHALGDPMMFGDTSWSDAGTETAESYDRRIGDGHDGMYYFGLSDDGKFDANRSDRGLLCVNHEYVVAPYGLHPAGSTKVDGKRPADEVDKEIFAHGASVAEVRRKAGGNDMEMVRGSKYNRRVHSATPMDMGGPAKGNAKLVNKLSPTGTEAFGMNNNCACGYTPWGTYLTCEENYLNVIGRAAGDDAKRSASEIVALKRYGLPAGRKNPYGWDTPDGEQYQRWNSKVSGASAADSIPPLLRASSCWAASSSPCASRACANASVRVASSVVAVRSRTWACSASRGTWSAGSSVLVM